MEDVPPCLVGATPFFAADVAGFFAVELAGGFVAAVVGFFVPFVDFLVSDASEWMTTAMTAAAASNGRNLYVTVFQFTRVAKSRRCVRTTSLW